MLYSSEEVCIGCANVVTCFECGHIKSCRVGAEVNEITGTCSSRVAEKLNPTDPPECEENYLCSCINPLAGRWKWDTKSNSYICIHCGVSQ